MTNQDGNDVNEPVTSMADSLPVLVISLPQSPRRALIASRLQSLNIDFRFIDAIHGQTLCETTIAAVTDPARSLRRLGRLLTPNEIGCALSHREAYRQIIESGADAAIILEDDAIPATELASLIEQWRSVPAAIDLLSLFKGSGIIIRQGGFKLGDARLARAASTIEYACGYFIRRKTAIKLFAATEKISTVADWPFDLRELRHYVTEPDFVSHDFSVPSEIGEDRPGFIEPPPPITRKILGLQALLFITYFRQREKYDSLYNYYERELRVRLMARLPWRYEILPGYYRWPEQPVSRPHAELPNAGQLTAQNKT
jgi:GR25 family glycosyltransferase involved in LPS biosynthesis